MTMWGPFALSTIKRAGVKIGWGVVCGRHANACDDCACKKQLQFGTKNPLTEQQVVVLLKQWCLEGFKIREDSETGQITHVHCVDIRTLDAEASDRDLDARLQACLNSLGAAGA